MLLACAFIFLLGLVIRGIWQYLILKKMYKSYPILVTYIILVFFSALEIGYEFYMGFACGEHDCLDSLIA